MHRLRLLGGLELRGPGPPLSGRAGQPKRLALLAILGAGLKPTSRDRLIGRLWPELDESGARHQLAASVYDLRHALGKDSVLKVGDGLRLNPKRVSCDVLDFEGLLRVGAREEGVRLYTGPFLDGFFVPHAPEFERWSDEQRDRLARRHAQAVEALAEERERGGAVRDAAEWWQVLVYEDPYCSQKALRFMKALVAAGEVRRAVQHAEVHAALVREEMDMEPDGGVLELAEELRGAHSRVGAPPRVPPAQAEAHGEYVRGRHFWSRRTHSGLLKAIEHFERAISLDPTHARAHADLAFSLRLLPEYGDLHPGDVRLKAIGAAERALELDPTIAEAHVAVGMVKAWEWDHKGAERCYRTAIALDPGCATAHHVYALLLAFSGRTDDALLEIDTAQELDPVSRVITSSRAVILYWAGRSDEAIAEWAQALELDPSFVPAYWWIAMGYLRKGMGSEALTKLREAVAMSGGSPGAAAALAYGCAVTGATEEAREILVGLEQKVQEAFVSPARLALGYVGLGDVDVALRMLERAEKERDPWLEFVLMEPRLRRVLGRPRISQLARRIGVRV